MSPLQGYEILKFETIDGTTITGWFYSVNEKAPVLIMTPGFNCVKEMLLPELAENFQSQGINAYIYDPRSTGDSGGLPRNQIDPLRQAEDLSDIITHISTLASVDAKRICLWGMSFGGTVSGCTVAVDRRVKALIMVCPILSFVKAEKREKAFNQLIRDRQSQLRGNEPFTLLPFNAKGENPIGMAGSGGPGGLESYSFMNAVTDRGAPNFRNRITLQTYHKLAMFHPKEILKTVTTTPIMMVTPELDAMSPPEEQIECFEKFTQPKKFYLAKGRGHLTVISGDDAQDITNAQVDFLKTTLKESVLS